MENQYAKRTASSDQMYRARSSGSYTLKRLKTPQVKGRNSPLIQGAVHQESRGENSVPNDGTIGAAPGADRDGKNQSHRSGPDDSITRRPLNNCGNIKLPTINLPVFESD